MDKWLYLPVFVPIISAVIVYLFNRDGLYYGLYLLQAMLLGVSATFLVWTQSGKILEEVVGGWDPVIGIALKLDYRAALLLMLSVVLFTVLLIYVHKGKENDYKFLFFFMMIEGAFNGFILSDDLFNLFVMLELITILSTILILYKKDGHSLKAGIYYLLFNSLGMIFFLIGVVMVYSQYGTLNISLLASIVREGEPSGTLRFAMVLLISGLSVKSAVFPVYDWLPKAHSASLTSISALLSGLLVKAGIIGLIKLEPIFSIYAYQGVFMTLGFGTAAMGVIFAFSQKDIKQILSFHTVSQIGLIIVGFSINIDIAMLYLINHSLIKSLLFLSSGVVINHYGERRVTHIHGMWNSNKGLSVLLILGATALAGLPLTDGFISKATLSNAFGIKGVLGLMLINMLTAASMAKILGILPGETPHSFEMNKRKALSMGLLAAFIIFTGVAMTDPVQGSHALTYYLKVKNLIKWVVEFGLGAGLYLYFKRNEWPLMKHLRHFSIDFPDGVIMLTFYLYLLSVTIK